VSYYRDDNGLEVDIIIEGDDGAWAAFEIKLGQDLLDDAATHLVRFSEKIDTERMGKPASLVILTGSGYAYTRRDGVHVVPIDLLVA
jgi:predicted AAA+ superfamily ATPase